MSFLDLVLQVLGARVLSAAGPVVLPAFRRRNHIELSLDLVLSTVSLVMSCLVTVVTNDFAFVDRFAILLRELPLTPLSIP